MQESSAPPSAPWPPPDIGTAVLAEVLQAAIEIGEADGGTIRLLDPATSALREALGS